MKRQTTIGTKIDSQAAGLLQHLAESRGMTTSELLANMVAVVLKLASVGKTDDPLLNECMFLWEAAERGQTNLTQNGKAEVVEAVYLLRQVGKRGTEAVMVEQGAAMFGDAMMTQDANEILDTILHSLSPDARRRLMAIGKRVDISKPIEALIYLLNYYEQHEDEDHNFIAEMFNEQSAYHYGRDMQDLTRYKRKKNKSIYNEQGQKIQQRDLFDEVGKTEGHTEDGEAVDV